MARAVTGNAATPSSPSSPEGDSPSKRGRKEGGPEHPAALLAKGRSAVPAGDGCSLDRRRAASSALAAAMTNSRRFHRSCSLRAPKAPVLLDLGPGGGYDPLEGGRTPGKKEESSGAQRGVQGRWARRAASLRAGKASRRKEGGHEEATGLPTATQGDAVAHSVLPGGDDGQLLLGEDWDRAGGRMQKCKKVRKGARSCGKRTQRNGRPAALVGFFAASETEGAFGRVGISQEAPPGDPHVLSCPFPISLIGGGGEHKWPREGVAGGQVSFLALRGNVLNTTNQRGIPPPPPHPPPATWTGGSRR